MTPALQELVAAYSRSKVLRLGVAYSESCYVGKTEVADQTGLSENVLRHYGTIATNYWPQHARGYKRWTDKEDNYIMANYQRQELDTVCEALPGRSRRSITQRAFRLGVTRARQQI